MTLTGHTAWDLTRGGRRSDGGKGDGWDAKATGQCIPRPPRHPCYSTLDADLEKVPNARSDHSPPQMAKRPGPIEPSGRRLPRTGAPVMPKSCAAARPGGHGGSP